MPGSSSPNSRQTVWDAPVKRDSITPSSSARLACFGPSGVTRCIPVSALAPKLSLRTARMKGEERGAAAVGGAKGPTIHPGTHQIGGPKPTAPPPTPPAALSNVRFARQGEGALEQFQQMPTVPVFKQETFGFGHFVG